MADEKATDKAAQALAGSAPTPEEAEATAATPQRDKRDSELLQLVQAVNEGRASEDELDKRRVHRARANVNIAGIAAMSEGWVPRDDETRAQVDAGLLELIDA